MTSERKKVHEKYHKKTKKQVKIIKDNNFTYKLLIRYISKYLKEGDSILDIGTGAGTLALYFANKGYNVTGIDISERAIKACQESQKELKITNIKFLVDDFQNTKIKNKFDFIIFTEVIEHLENDKLQLEKINNLLKPNGTLFLSTPSINAPMYRLGLANDFDKKVGHLRRYSKQQIISLVKNNDFKILEVVENEGVIRNFFFLNDHAGKLIRYFKFFIGNLITILDNLSLKLFGESNYFVIARKRH